MKRFTDQVVLVTGAAQGIGAAAARRFAAEGATVMLTDVLDDLGEALARELRAKEAVANYQHLDVSSESGWARVVDLTQSLGRLTVLVNNAGIASAEDVEHETREAFDRVVAVNQTGVWLGMRAVAKAMRPHGGAIVNVSSIYGASGGTGASIAYHGTKGAVRLMTKSAAIHWAKDRIRVCSVHPGFVETPMVAPFTDPESPAGRAMLDYIEASTPMGRMARPEEIASAIAFLASSDASYITGAELYVDGGFTAA